MYNYKQNVHSILTTTATKRGADPVFYKRGVEWGRSHDKNTTTGIHELCTNALHR